MITIEKLSNSFLPTITLSAKAGECICIYGESGSGKTLLLRAIADLDPNTGNVSLDHLSREQIAADQWRKQVTYLPAESHWWSETVKDHFQEPLPDWSELALAKQISDWKIAHLSSGERQRLALLRALQHQPSVLLLDEITANLDSENTQRVEKRLKRETDNGLTLIMVSHDASQRERLADRIFKLDKKQLVEES